MKDYKYPDDFEGWKELGKFMQRYLVLRSPDEQKLALICDNNVAFVMGRRPSWDIYGGDPFVVGALEKLRAMGDLDRFAAEAYRKARLY
jgi:hypothetical protein